VKAILFKTNYWVKSLKLERQHMMYNRGNIQLGLTCVLKFNILD